MAARTVAGKRGNMVPRQRLEAGWMHRDRARRAADSSEKTTMGTVSMLFLIVASENAIANSGFNFSDHVKGGC